ncbi:hypothetical protein F0L17_14485 [Streptomyces sp. TRM43335]|uniref:Uncharacterized protein n=1 Tax=Streptomyces taklimakanensis TaxID=2569853 RepID=A0A6G2BDK1_9ACTN|nr:hypothetical protein [Streptomyces taklimakanensis]MTE20294.1 hypothetical protein [Streptomyces taklimakanensis]
MTTTDRDRIADVLARHYDGRSLADLRDEHAQHHLEAADALIRDGQDINRTTPGFEQQRLKRVLAECDAMEQAMVRGHASLSVLREHIDRIRAAAEETRR